MDMLGSISFCSVEKLEIWKNDRKRRPVEGWRKNCRLEAKRSRGLDYLMDLAEEMATRVQQGVLELL